jgi:hypothetical protein
MKKNLIKSIIKECIKSYLVEHDSMTTRNDLDQGVMKAVNLEITNQPQQSVYPENFKSVPNYIRIKKSGVPNEIVVAWYSNGKFNDSNSYYTNDIKDAVDTFKVMQRQVDVSNMVKEQSSSTQKPIIINYEDYPNEYEAEKAAHNLAVGHSNVLVKVLFAKNLGAEFLNAGVRYEELPFHKWDEEEAKRNYLKEQSSTASATPGGQEGGMIRTPGWVSKNKEGSPAAIKAAKKYGTVVKSIAEKGK